jgi:hypothetical protein
MRELTDDEHAAIAALAAAWNAFLTLPSLHPDDTDEFRHGVHALQNIVLSRPALEALNRLAPKSKVC